MTRPGGELTTYRARGGHATDLVMVKTVFIPHMNTVDSRTRSSSNTSSMQGFAQLLNWLGLNMDMVIIHV